MTNSYNTTILREPVNDKCSLRLDRHSVAGMDEDLRKVIDACPRIRWNSTYDIPMVPQSKQRLIPAHPHCMLRT